MERSARRGSTRFLVLVAALLILWARGPSGNTCLGEDGADVRTLLEHRGLVRLGDEGEVVRAVQEALSSLGYSLSVDGIFGTETRSELVAFQRDKGLYPDGIAGPATLAALSREYLRANPPETHTVKQGETLSGIADLYGIDLATLIRLNPLLDPDLIYVGQTLVIREHEEAEAEEEPVPAKDVSVPDLLPPAPVMRVCLTFDDGPDIGTTRPILSVLRSYGVKATFFLRGDMAARYPDLVREIAAEGHVIGIHGYEHKPLVSLSPAEVARDLRRAIDTLQSITGVRPWLYRPPGGRIDAVQLAEVERLGLVTLMWTNIGGADLWADTPSEVVQGVTESARDGAVILLHEGLQRTVEALPSVIETLARAGFGFQNVERASLPVR